ncbi:MAG: lipid-A-disaccharide synthase [Hyphomicrobiales bacterium]|jgi:lipid-A-disaccharide synthase
MSVTPQSPKRVFFVVGEASGDRLGASLAAELKATHGDAVAIEGLGGEGLAEHGLTSLFDIEDIAVMGLAPVIARLPLILRRIRQTSDAIIASKPDLVVLIDSPDFTHRVANRVRKIAPSIPIVGWVSPSVWAWRPGRAKAMRAYMDHLLVLLPFEVGAHQDLGGPPATYVGHPLIGELDSLRPQDPTERPELGTEAPTVLVMPGSRSGEIARHMPILRETLIRTNQLLAEDREMQPTYILPSVPKHETTLVETVKDWPIKIEVVSEQAANRAAMRTAHAAIVASGTATLELALAGIPMVVLYKLDFLAHLARRLVKVWTIILPNLVLGRPVVREYVDETARPEALARAMVALVTDTPERRAQVEAFEELDGVMAGPDSATPARRARRIIDSFLYQT